MNHLYTIFLCICLTANTALAQTTPNPAVSTQATVIPMVDSLSWLIQGPKNAGAVSIVVDERDNIFLAGYIEDSAVFENSTLVAGGKVDGFIARYSPTGELQWIRQLRGPRVEIIFSMAIDQKGDIYCTGMFQETLQLGDTVLKAQKQGAFLVKYAANGDLQWARLIGKGGLDSGKSLALDQSGNIYVTGYVGDLFTMNDVLLRTFGQNRAFVAKYDPQGTLQWMKELEGESYGASIATDGQDGIYVGGIFMDTLQLGDTRLVAPSVPSKGIFGNMGMQEGFLMKLDPKGRYQWAKRMGGYVIDTFDDVAIDKKGNVYVRGMFTNNEASFDTIPLISDDQESQAILNMDNFITKLDSKGGVQWIVNKATFGLTNGRSLALGSDGSLYVAGTLPGNRRLVNQMVSTQGDEDIILTHFSPEGKLLDIRQHGGADTETVGGMYLSPKGDIYVLGGFQKAIPGKEFINHDYSKNRGFFFVKKYSAP